MPSHSGNWRQRRLCTTKGASVREVASGSLYLAIVLNVTEKAKIDGVLHVEEANVNYDTEIPAAGLQSRVAPLYDIEI